jgi:hypothetical protein
MNSQLGRDHPDRQGAIMDLLRCMSLRLARNGRAAMSDMISDRNRTEYDAMLGILTGGSGAVCKRCATPAEGRMGANPS